MKLKNKRPIKINKYRPVAYIYFFINSYGLPHGLLFTGLLTPVFFVWLTLNKKKDLILKFALVLLPFALLHFVNGVNIKFYFISTLLLFSAYIFTYTFKTFLEKKRYLEALFYKFTKINFILTLLAAVAFFTPFWDLFWIRNSVSDKLHNFPRLAMFTYEPSYYSTLLVPVFLFFLASFMEHPRLKYIKPLLLLLLSFVLSFALGVISTIVLAVLLLIIIRLRYFLKNKAFVKSAAVIFMATAVILILLLIFYPDNPLFLRLFNILNGRDTSARGRTVEAFQLAYQVAAQKSVLWGAGLGQIKEVGDAIIRTYYSYSRAEIPVVTIPCAAAETVAIFGLSGLFIRIAVELYLFFKTKVMNSNYRLMLFLYIFIYQFTGSYITNIAEYAIWVLAFVPYFTQFEQKPGLSTLSENL